MAGPDKDNTLLISMHMEKCGGTSLDRLLRAQYGQGFHLYDRYEDQAEDESQLPTSASCLHGHMFYGLHRHFPQSACHYITLLRNPIDRFVSNFEHILLNQHPLQNLLSGDDGFDVFCTHTEARHYRNLFVRRLANVFGEINMEDLNRAEENLRKFAVVGQLENLDGFIRACAERFGWQNPQLAHHNKTPNAQRRIGEFGREQRQKASAANEWDCQLMLRVKDLIVA